MRCRNILRYVIVPKTKFEHQNIAVIRKPEKQNKTLKPWANGRHKTEKLQKDCKFLPVRLTN